MVKAQVISYCAVIGSVDELGSIQWAKAVRRCLPLYWNSVVVGDGAEWINRIYQQCYNDSVRMIDWYHACEHLAVLVQQAFGQGSEKGQYWLKNREANLWRGEVHKVVCNCHRLTPFEPRD